MWPGLGKVWCIGLLITTSTQEFQIDLEIKKKECFLLCIPGRTKSNHAVVFTALVKRIMTTAELSCHLEHKYHRAINT